MQQPLNLATPRLNTPWGVADDVTTLAPGICFVSTPSHGGFWLSPERRAEMPEPYRSIKTFAGGNWYEEDCDCALVILAFPDVFPKEQDTARAVFNAFHARKVQA